jgi:hypothetical protein
MRKLNLKFLAAFAFAFALVALSVPALARAVPAQFQGLWCGSGALGGAQMNMTQNDRDLKIELVAMGRTRAYDATIKGRVATVPTSSGDTALALELEGSQLHIVGARESLAMFKGQSLTRANGASCS